MRAVAFLAALLAASSSPGCVKYVDQPTPPGTVPRPAGTPRATQAPDAAASLRPGRPFGVEAAVEVPLLSVLVLPLVRPVTAGIQAVQGVLAEPTSPPQAQGRDAYSDAAFSADKGTSRFGQLYREAGQPRLVVFFNRVLSEEVREWRSGREVSSSATTRTESGVSASSARGSATEGDGRVVADSSQTGAVAVTGSTETRSEKHSEYVTKAPGKRTGPDEEWMWALEEGVADSLLEARVRVVDRSTIVRLTAAKEGARAEIPTLETAAIRDLADVLVELTVHADRASPLGYTFRVVAKATKNGEILASDSVRRISPAAMRKHRRVTTGPSGYVVTPDTFPAVKEVAGEVASVLLTGLERYWDGN